MTKTKAADRLVWITLPNGKTTQVRAYSTEYHYCAACGRTVGHSTCPNAKTTTQVSRAARPLALTRTTRTLRDCGFTR